MRNKGFTLIELLAVITVIAIIATITVIVTNKIIKNTKNTLLERQKLTIEEAARDYYLKEGMNANFDSKESCVNLSKLLSKGYLETKEVVNPKTKETMDGSVIITYSANQYNYKYQDTVCDSSNGQVVYFDVTTGKTCDNYTEENSNTGYNGIDGTENQNGCLKFYIFNDFGSDKVNLILDHNTTAKVAWISKDDYISAGGEDLSAVVSCQYGGLCATTEFGPITSLTQLKNDTALWQGIETPENYIMDQVGQTSNANYAIKYKDEGYKARLITPNEVATIVENTSFDERTDIDTFYFDTNTSTASPTCKEGNTTGCKYGWLYDRTATICTTYGCSNNSDLSIPGYWTSTSRADNANNAWNVNYYGNVYYVNITSSSSYGVRPVIEVLKSKLSQYI